MHVINLDLYNMYNLSSMFYLKKGDVVYVDL